MKTKFITPALMGAVILFLAPSHSQIQDNEKGTSMAPILAEALPIVREVEGKEFEIVRMEFDLVSETKTTYRSLYQQWSYGVIAFGDYRLEDIDVAVYKDVDGKWFLVEKDTDARSKAAVVIKPSSSGTYRIDVKAYKFKPGYSVGRYGLVVFHE